MKSGGLNLLEPSGPVQACNGIGFPYVIYNYIFVFREAVSNLWSNLLHNNESDVAVTEKRRRVTIATVWFILTLILAVLSPDIGSVIDILGSLAAVFIFVFPGKLYLCFQVNYICVSR
jgi:phosphatidylglycerophosphate synthase